MILRRKPLSRMQPINRRLAGIARGNKFGNVKRMHDGRSYASGLERDTFLILQQEERDGKIRNLQTQVTHGLYVGHPIYPENGKYARASCTCMFNQGEPMPGGLEKIYSPQLDFQFEECAGGNMIRPQIWVLIYADAKGFQDAKQRQGYRLFAAIHGQKIRLYTAHGVK